MANPYRMATPGELFAAEDRANRAWARVKEIELQLATERAARERAEAERDKYEEAIIVGSNMQKSGGYSMTLEDAARAILAKRKEGEQVIKCEGGKR